VSFLGQYWGTIVLVAAVQPSLADDRESLEAVARCQRASATPRTAAAQYRYINGVDVREALPLVQSPTLVLHNEDNATIKVASGRYLAEHIPEAQLITFQTPTGDVRVSVLDPSLDAIATFLTGRRPPVEIDRVLATVLFLDIVDSTQHLVNSGDRHWRQVLDQHDRLVRDELQHFRGHEVKTTGDGFVATFDGPARAIRCAHEIIREVAKLGIDVRVGLHTGECELRDDDIAGITVHVAARIGALAGPSQILVSSTVKDLVAGSEIEFQASGEHSLKSLPGVWSIFTVAL
jgi:class 3 adenylate cyclase